MSESTPKPFAGRTALITGSGQNIGRAIALAFARLGANSLDGLLGQRGMVARGSMGAHGGRIRSNHGRAANLPERPRGSEVVD